MHRREMCFVVLNRRLKNSWTAHIETTEETTEREKKEFHFIAFVVKCVCATLWLDDFVIVCHILDSIVLALAVCTWKMKKKYRVFERRKAELGACVCATHLCPVKCVKTLKYNAFDTKFYVSFATSFSVRTNKKERNIFYIFLFCCYFTCA